MKFRDYYRGLSMEEKRRFAERAGTTHNYVYVHVQHATKRVSLDLFGKLVAATEGKVSAAEMLEHFDDCETRKHDDLLVLKRLVEASRGSVSLDRLLALMTSA